MFYNPGALPFGSGLSIEAGVFAEHERDAVTPSGGATLRSDGTTASPTLFVSQRLGDHFAMGLGLYRAPSQRSDYGPSQVGAAQIERARFDGLVFSPTVAGRPFPFLSIGFGLTVVFGNVDLVQAAGPAGGGTRAAFSGTAVGIGGSVGVWARLYREYLTLGVGYRSSVGLDQTGSAKLTPSGGGTSQLDAKLTLPMPHVLTLGLASQPRPGLAISLEARVALLRDLSGFFTTTTSDPAGAILSIPVPLEEKWQLRAGVEQRLLGDHLAVRAGAGYDLGAARKDVTPAIPDGDRVVLSAGLGYLSRLVDVDAGYLVLFAPGSGGNRGFTNPAEYASVRHVMGLTLTVRVPQLGAQPTWRD